MAPFKTIGLPDGLTERPICPNCNAMMRLVWIAASRQGEDRHTFECPACKKEIETRLDDVDTRSSYDSRH
jgi:DNA-directed RNA polymerase subunit M/transcription elongation factor TFIIS